MLILNREVTVKLRYAAPLGALALAVSLAAVAVGRPSSDEAPAPAAAEKKRCSYVVKRVRGKKRRVKVCRTVPTPAPPVPSPVLARIDVGTDAWVVTAAEDGSIWSDGATGVVRIDPATNRISLRTTFQGVVSAGLGSVWVTSDRTLRRLDPATGAVQAMITLPELGERVLALPGALWVTAPDAQAIMRIDPATRAVVATVPACDVKPHGLTEAGGSLWVACYVDGQVLRIDTESNRVVDRIRLAYGVHSLAIGAGSIWVTNRESGQLSRIDMATRRVVATLRTGSSPAVLFALGAVWVSGGDAVLKIDPATNRVAGRLPVGFGDFYGLAYGSGSLWLSTIADRRVLRLDPTRLRK